MTRRSQLYSEAKRLGIPLEGEYREMTVDSLTRAFLAAGEELPDPEPKSPRKRKEPPAPEPSQTQAAPQPEWPSWPVLRTDEQGRQWIQEEVRKPAYPKPRGRRVLTYMDTGVEKQTVQVGEYIETFEVAGNRQGRASEIRITLPSYQTGIYIDPRFPMFRVHTYNSAEGFNFHDVNAYYGGSELVPATVKRIYVSSDLCYDIRSVIQAINAEYRQMQLSKGF